MHDAVLSLWVLIEAAVLALLWTPTVLARDAHAYRLLLRFSAYLGLFTTLVGLVMLFTPLRRVAFNQLVGLSASLTEFAIIRAMV